MHPINTSSLSSAVEPIRRELSIRELFARLARRKWSMLLTIGIFLALGVTAGLVAEPSYRSDMELNLQGMQLTPNIMASDPLDAVSLPFSNIDFVTQVELLQSYDVVLPAFQSANVTLPPPGSPENGPTVEAKAIPLSNSVVVSVFANDPNKAQEVALAIPAAFNKYIEDQRNGQVQTLITSFTTKVREQSTQLSTDLQAVAKFRSQHNLSASEGEQTEILARVSRAQEAKNMADAQLQSAQKRFDELSQARKEVSVAVGKKSQPNALAEVAQQEATLSALIGDRDQLRVTYLDGSTQIKEAEAKIAQQRKLLRDAQKRSREGTDVRNPEVIDLDNKVRQAQAELSAAQAASKTYDQSYNEAKAKLDVYTTISPQLAALNSKVALDQQSLEASRRRLDEIQARSSSIKQPAAVVQAPSLAKKVKPSWLLNIGASLAFGILFGIGIVSWREQVDDRVTSAGKAYELTGLSPLAFLPRMGRTPKSTLAARTGLPGALQNRYRMLRYGLQFALRPDEPRAIMVASARRKEGRSSVAQNLAVSLAADGNTVLLVDADIVSRGVSGLYSASNEAGLMEVLQGQASLPDVLRPTSSQGLLLLPSGKEANSAADLFASHKMTDLVQQLKATADFVIFDTSAILSSVDASVLGAQLDAAIILAEMGVTRSQDLRRGVGLLQSSGSTIAGIAFVNSMGEDDSTMDVAL